MRVRLGRMLVLSFTVLVVAGCGLGQKAADKAADKLVSGLTGGLVNVDSSSGTVSFTGDDGAQINMSVQEGKVPDGFVLPVFPGWTAGDFVVTNTNDEVGWMGTFYFDDDPRTTAERYQKELEALGLEVNSMAVEDEGEYSNVMFVGGAIGGKGYGGMMTFSVDEGQPQLTLMFGESKAEND